MNSLKRVSGDIFEGVFSSCVMAPPTALCYRIWGFGPPAKMVTCILPLLQLYATVYGVLVRLPKRSHVRFPRFLNSFRV